MANLISLPVLLFVVGGAAVTFGSLVVPLGDRGMPAVLRNLQFAVMFLALFLWVRYKEKRPVRSLGYLSGRR